jgi:hypothetical protein
MPEQGIEPPFNSQGQLSPLERRIADALFAETWIDYAPDQPTPDWHHQFQWWQAVLAARIAAKTVSEHAE